eukprot:2040443-Rhodomonas_salina.1
MAAQTRPRSTDSYSRQLLPEQHAPATQPPRHSWSGAHVLHRASAPPRPRTFVLLEAAAWVARAALRPL